MCVISYVRLVAACKLGDDIFSQLHGFCVEEWHSGSRVGGNERSSRSYKASRTGFALLSTDTEITSAAKQLADSVRKTIVDKVQSQRQARMLVRRQLLVFSSNRLQFRKEKAYYLHNRNTLPHVLALLRAFMDYR
jgi:hypothetical protein